MRRPFPIVLCLSIAATAAEAQIETFRFDMPGDLGIFGRAYQADDLTPMLQGHVVDVRLNVNFDTDAGIAQFHDAADILFQLQFPTTNVPFWDVSGEDLGWAGTGRFSASISTDAFNGDELLYDPNGGFLLWFKRIVSRDDQNPFLGGTLTDSYWEVDIQVVPAPGVGVVLLAGAGVLLRRRR